MKKLTILLTLLALTLTACGASDSTEAASSTRADSSARTLSDASLLLIGSLKLEGTGQAITSAQAAELLPLWQVFGELTNSDTAAQAEKDALIKQIEETMTAEQTKAIQAMNLTPQDSFTLMQEMGLGRGGGSFPGGDNAPQDGDGPPFDGGGGFPGGGPPDGGGGGGFPGPGGDGGFPGQGGGGQNLTQEQIATAQAARAEQAGGNFLPPALLEALIKYLQELAGG